MEISEAKAVVLDPESSFTDKYYAVAAIVGNPSVQPEDLLDCLDVGGVSAETAATKLHTLTGRDADNGVLGVYLDRQSWEEYLKKNQ